MYILLAIINVIKIINEIIKYIKFISKEYTIAIKAIDIKSSTTAKDNKNTLSAGLNLLENKINIENLEADVEEEQARIKLTIISKPKINLINIIDKLQKIKDVRNIKIEE